jgi:alginate O-acetyltransferase complex protein AlgI
MVNFSDLNFIFRFLPVFLLAFYLTPIRFRQWTLLLGSLLFYAVGDLRMFPALFVAVIVNFLFAKAQLSEKSKSLLAFIVVIDAGMLIEFKILGQYVDKALLPIGISFYIFKMISFQVDAFRSKVPKDTSFLNVAAYFTMFPQVIMGPIMRYERYLDNPMLSGKPSKTDVAYAIEDGLRFFAAGLAMKVLIADHLAMLWNDIGTIGYESISTPLAWLGAASYSLELYFDFWGYSLMSAGIGVMIGFPFITNFDHPYSSGSISEFYRRWHATLGSWFRDYIYIPLGGSRKGELRTVINLLVVWLITGFWHGITLNFIVWGISLCLIIILERLVVFKHLPKPLAWIVGKLNVLVLIPLTWVVFAISDPFLLGNYFKRLFPFWGQGIAVNQGDFMKNITVYWPILLPALILLIPGIFDFWANRRNRVVFNVIWLAMFWACIYSLAGAAGNPFMYFRF